MNYLSEGNEVKKNSAAMLYFVGLVDLILSSSIPGLGCLV